MTDPNYSTTFACRTAHSIWRVLLYFEVFSYPLTAKEIFHYLDFSFDASDQALAIDEVKDALDEMVAQGRIVRFGDFYQTQDQPSWVEARLDCNRRADEYLPLANRMARFIGCFPFIRGVFVSGSLSKHCMKPDSDIDFFIITAPGRLWLARTLLVLFKKIFLFNSHKYFCVNYFIDTEHLEIEEKNLFTATEIVTLLPLYGREWCVRFFESNRWAQRRYPNFRLRLAESTPFHRRSWGKKWAEYLLSGRLGHLLDRQTMRLTVGYWRRKFSHFNPETFNVALKSRQYVSKHHPLHFQQRVLVAYEKRVKEMGVL